MTNPFCKLAKGTNPLGRDQRGITGLDTAIVLIAFVVVSSVFAYATLSTGLFATDQARKTIHAGLSQARGTMELKGSVIATAGNTGSNGTVNTITLHVSNAAAGEAIDLSVGNTIIKYSDTNQVLNLDTAGEFTTTGIGSHDGDIRLEEGEIFEIQIPNMVALLDPDLGTDQTFTLEVIPPNGAVLFIQRSTPISMPAVTSLD